MTTIAYRDGTISADSQISYATIHNGTRDKIAHCGKFFVGLAGSQWLRPLLEDWITEGAPADAVPEALLENSEKFNAIVVDADGNVANFENGYLVPVEADYTAIGSGMVLALGAMAHGASAEEAVAAAAKHDKNTGGPIRSWTISSLDS